MFPTTLRSAWIAAVVVFLAAVGVGVRAEEAKPPAAAMSALKAPADVAKWIDAQLAKNWSAKNVEPAPIVNDATFLRRIYLDLVGTIPPVSQTRDFLDDSAPDKRQKLVERLVSDQRHASHMSRLWRRILVPRGSPNEQFAPQLEPWLKEQFAKNSPYNAMSRELITSPRSFGAGPGAFYQAIGAEPTTSASAVSRVFLGLRIGCAECHNHPFASWTQDEFWQLAAFYSGGDQKGPGSKNSARGTIRRPKDEQTFRATFLRGESAQFSEDQSPKEALADWIIAHPSFAAVCVNRVWQNYFGHGVAHPVDDVDTTGEPPAWLKDLAAQFIEAKYDLRWLTVSICLSDAYQRSSEMYGDQPCRDFTHMSLKTLPSDAIFDSLEQALGLSTTVSYSTPRYNNQRRELIEKLKDSIGSAPEDYNGGAIQTLLFMNGDLVASGVDPGRSRTLSAIAESPFMTPSQKIETLYLAALVRPPRREELRSMLAYVAEKDRKETSRAYGDVFWTLLNSPEFVLNR